MRPGNNFCIEASISFFEYFLRFSAYVASQILILNYFLKSTEEVFNHRDKVTN